MKAPVHKLATLNCPNPEDVRVEAREREALPWKLAPRLEWARGPSLGVGFWGCRGLRDFVTLGTLGLT